MNYTLQTHEGKHIFPIPDGLKELSSDIIREVLRHQPEKINEFIADYLEMMMVVRDQARDSSVVLCEVFEDAMFYDELHRRKNVTREEAGRYATIIQANWRGYVVRRKISEWMKKKQKFVEEKERKQTLRIEELLAGLGITYEEAVRAAGVIQTAYKESKKGKWISGDFGELWVEETIPFGQRIREGDRAQGRFDKWEKEDFGDFFEMDNVGGIKYVWPKVGQIRKVKKEETPPDADVIEFFAMRDLDGKEQYAYVIKSKSDCEMRGVPIGFLLPIPLALARGEHPEVEFTNPENASKMGNYTFVFRDTVDRKELKKFDELLKANAKLTKNNELIKEFDYDPHWVLPRVLVRIKEEYLKESDDEVKFKCLPEGVVCEEEKFKFRAETIEQTAKIVRHILRDNCLTVEQALSDAANMSPYKVFETGRIFPVDDIAIPDFIQKAKILPQKEDHMIEETKDIVLNEYIYLPLRHPNVKKMPKEPTLNITIMRFQGYQADYKGSFGLQGKVFVFGPKLAAINGKHFTYESLFWEEFGEEAWSKLLYDIPSQEEEPEREEEEEEIGEVESITSESEPEEQEDTIVQSLKPEATVTKEERSEMGELTEMPYNEGPDLSLKESQPPPAEEEQSKTEGEGEAEKESAKPGEDAEEKPGEDK